MGGERERERETWREGDVSKFKRGAEKGEVQSVDCVVHHRVQGMTEKEKVSTLGCVSMEERPWPTAEDVMNKIKDDGDFDSLRLKIIQMVKEKEELRNNIIDQVKQSDILNQDGSEDMKPRQLSDAIYQELGRKIMGQISDEIWKVISSNDSIKDDIRGTVESVFNKMVSTEPQGSKCANPSLTVENQIVGREANGINSSTAIPTCEANILNSNETNKPPDFTSSGHQVDKSKNSELHEPEQSSGLFQHPPELFIQSEAQPPGFGASHGGGEADDDSDLPPGFS